MDDLTIAMQNYLETIFALSKEDAGARVSDIAARLDVSKASVNHAVNVLSSQGYVATEKYQEIYLTEAGRREARFLEAKHGLLKALFTDIIGIPDQQADIDACAIEHVISRESVEKIHEYLQRQGIDLISTHDT